MASPYHHHHHQNHPPTTTCCCTTSFSSCHCTQSHPSYPPPHPYQPPPDPLLQAIASQLLISNPPDPYPYLHHHHNQNPHKPHHPKQPPQIPQHQLHSLLSRIEALEASLHHHSRSSNSFSLRDYAARVIQTHFRAFLVRRSRTLRQLKYLAFIKSSFASLKSSVSNQTHFDFHSVSQKAMALLIKLDTIQCGDPIVRDGRRSLSRDLVRFLEFVEGVMVKRQGVRLKPVKNVRPNARPVQNVSKFSSLGKDQREMIGKLKERIEKIRGFARVNEEEDVELEGFQHVSDDDEEEGGGRCEGGAAVKKGEYQPKLKKSVSFAENENMFTVFSNCDETASSGDGSDSSDDHRERVGDCSEVENVKGFAQETVGDDEARLEIGESPQTSDAERNPRGRMSQRRSHGQGQNEHLLFSPPMPVKMDPKEDLVKRNKGVKILT